MSDVTERLLVSTVSAETGVAQNVKNEPLRRGPDVSALADSNERCSVGNLLSSTNMYL
jgi:hypothetical protein